MRDPAKPRDEYSLLRVLADIREAAGDPEGRLMQDELVRRIAVFRDALSEIASTAGSLQSMDINLRLAVERARDALEFRAVRGAP